MKSAVAFLALVALSQGVPLNTSLDVRIINGEDAKVGEIPYQVSLQFSPSYHYCGGSIVNGKYVVTAAHCVNGIQPYQMQIIAGTIDLKKPQSTHKIMEFIVHPEYNTEHSWTSDIALVKVDPPFQVSKTISYVPLPKLGAKVPAGKIAVTSGWGSLKYKGPSPTKLQRTDVLIANQEYCNNVNSAAGYPVYDSHICAYDPNFETGPCHRWVNTPRFFTNYRADPASTVRRGSTGAVAGTNCHLEITSKEIIELIVSVNGDSGGPLTVDGELVGIASWVISCGSSKNPTVYTRVPDFIDWIEANAI